MAELFSWKSVKNATEHSIQLIDELGARIIHCFCTIKSIDTDI